MLITSNFLMRGTIFHSDLLSCDYAVSTGCEEITGLHFIRRIRRVDLDWKVATATHFMAEGMAKSTVYRVINRYLAQGTPGTVERQIGSERPSLKMNSRNKRRLKWMVNHKTGLSQRALDSVFMCSQSYKKLKIRYRRRMKVPKYKDAAAMREAKKRFRIIYRLTGSSGTWTL